MERCADVWRCFMCRQEWLVIRAGFVSWEMIALDDHMVTSESYLLTGPAPAICPHCGGTTMPDALIYVPSDERATGNYDSNWRASSDFDLS
jgi:hypothetical protein